MIKRLRLADGTANLLGKMFLQQCDEHGRKENGMKELPADLLLLRGSGRVNAQPIFHALNTESKQ